MSPRVTSTAHRPSTRDTGKVSPMMSDTSRPTTKEPIAWRYVTFAEAKDEIEAILSYRRSQAVVDSVLTALREKAKIELNPDAYFQP